MGVAASSACCVGDVSVGGRTGTGILGPFGGHGAGGVQTVTIEGSIANGGTPGSVTLQWAQNASSATPTEVYQGSTLVAHRA
jgi:hypothetical protein